MVLQNQQRHTCVLWSGGKDSFLAYLLSWRKHGDSCVFVTFVPRTGVFRCHPLPILASHSQSFGVPHEFIVIDQENWLDGYNRAFAYLKRRYGIRRVVTGDILSGSVSITGSLAFPNSSLSWASWIDSLCGLDVHFEAPLSNLYAEDILELLAAYKVEAVITGLAQEWFTEGLLGKPLSLALLKSTPLFSNTGFDLCGERGEYHTTVIRFQQSIFYAVDPIALTSSLFKGVWVLDWDARWLDPPLRRIEIDENRDRHVATA